MRNKSFIYKLTFIILLYILATPLLAMASVEICDGIDNDGNGQVDEGFDSDRDGVADCFDNEECDLQDNDGNGQIDEGFDFDGDEIANCLDIEESDGFDNDGDGEIDEDFDSDEDGVSDFKDIEQCDGIDNNGDSIIDEGFDSDGNGVADCFSENEPPVAIAGLDIFVTPGEKFIVDATESSDPDGDVLLFIWTSLSSEMTVSFKKRPITTITAPTTEGVYVISLRVVDPSGLSSVDRLFVTVQGEGSEEPSEIEDDFENEVEVECNDLIDNDGNGLVDCDDPSCDFDDICTPADEALIEPEFECDDLIDNDENGLVDCDDPSCGNVDVCVENDLENNEENDVPPSDDAANFASQEIVGTTFIGCSLNTNCQINHNWSMSAVFIGAVILLLCIRIHMKNYFLFLAFFSTMMAGGAVQAKESRFDAINFTPTFDGGSYVTVYGAQTLQQWQPHFNLYLDYANKPLIFTGAAGDQSIIDYSLIANVNASLGLTDWLTVGANVPVVLYNSFFADTPIAAPSGIADGGFMMGDVGLGFKIRLLDGNKSAVGLALIPFVTFPTGDEIRYVGNGAITGGGLFAAEFKAGKLPLSFALNLGAKIRDNVVRHGITMDDEILFSGAANYKFVQDWEAIVELQGSTVAKDFFASNKTTPVEALASVRHNFGNTGLDLTAGAGFGVNNGVGTPRVRGFMGLGWTGKKPEPKVEPVVVKDDRIQDGKIVINWGKIYYDTNKTTIKPVSYPVLDEVVSVLNAHSEITLVEVQGHTDARASDAYNLKLSQGRANASRQYLIDKGISPDRLTAVGYGEAKPIATNDTDEGMGQNRRTEFVILNSQPSTESAPTH